MFIQNKYYYQYLRIVLNALIADRKRIPLEHESHHIMPKAIWPEYKNEDWNRVLLTHKEHYVCHHLLIKCLPSAAMTRALWFMAHNKGMPITSRVFANLRRNFAQATSDTHKGKVLSQETKDKIGAADYDHTYISEQGRQNIRAAGYKRAGKNNPMYGKDFSKEHRQRLSESRLRGIKDRANGLYVTPWGKFLTAGAASEASGYDSLNLTSLRRWCKQNMDVPVRRQSYIQCPYLNDLGESVVGKTFREIGFYYEPFYEGFFGSIK